LINAWGDKSGQSYDNTSQTKVVWTNHEEYFVLEGKLHEDTFDIRTNNIIIEKSNKPGLIDIIVDAGWGGEGSIEITELSNIWFSGIFHFTFLEK
jgi:hypothetical protein